MVEKPKKAIFNKTEIQYECIKCGECCRSGYKVFIKKEDIEIWKKLEKFEILEHIKIDPKCISLKQFNEDMDNDGDAIIKNKIKYDFKNSKESLRNLINFIEKNHLYQGCDFYPLDYITIMPNMRRNPIFIPKTYDSIFKGMNLGLNYIIQLNSKGFCPFLKLNSCTIHKIKPIACKRFPYKKDGTLRDDDYFFSICRGIKK
jgi:Fe-S-cluster containining protein